MTVNFTAGGVFDLNSFDIADYYDLGADAPIPFSYVQNGIIFNSTIAVDNKKGLQTVSLNLTDITSFSLTNVLNLATVGGFQIDNIVYNEPISGAVPEPSTWAMMIAGFGLVGGAMRRHQGNAARRSRRFINLAAAH